MNRSEIRHALYRAKNGIFAESKRHIYDMVEPKIPVNESWETFSINWDVFWKHDEITVIRPETDYDFIHTTCLEKSLHVKNNMSMDASDRQLNTIQIVELNMLDGKMDWFSYNRMWGVSVDHELKRINTRMFLTNVNIVTDEMIMQSASSDGAAMSEVPSIPSVSFGESEVISKEEFDKLVALVPKAKKNAKTK